MANTKQNNIDYTDEKALRRLFEMYMDDIYEKTETNKKLALQVAKEEELFCNILTEKQQKEFDKLSSLIYDNYEKIIEETFIYGFSLAVKLLMESVH